jgi:2-haloacid dehalogenase
VEARPHDPAAGHTAGASRAALVDAVLFDLGGVLIDWNPRHLYRQLIADEAAMEEFLATVCSPAWHDAHDRGSSTAESCAELAAAMPEHADLILAWADRTDDMVAGAIDGSVAILAELKAKGVPCYVLSNMEPETFPVRQARFPFLDWFDGHVISGFEGMAKPDPEIFALVIERFGLQPGRTLFIDDNPVNIDAATVAGLRAHRFETPALLRATLVGEGLLG